MRAGVNNLHPPGCALSQTRINGFKREFFDLTVSKQVARTLPTSRARLQFHPNSTHPL